MSTQCPSETFTDSESVITFDDFDDEGKGTVKRKTRNLSEKKRRDQFNMLINELSSMVSINSKKMDKSTILKSTILFLKNHQAISVKSRAHEIKQNWKPSFLSNDEFSQLMLEALDSFLIVFTKKGKILYVSESVTSLLGHLPSDLVNRSLYNFLHEKDRVTVFNTLMDYKTTVNETMMTTSCHIRRGTINLKDPYSYEHVQLSGTCRPWPGENDVTDSRSSSSSSSSESVCFCCTVRLNKAQIIRQLSVVNENLSEFTSRQSLEWKFLFLDHRAPPIIGYLPFEVLGTSGYDYYHPDDLEKICKCHDQLMQTGKGTTCLYRFLTKGQQWIWLKTQYYITYHQWNSKPEFIMCTNTVYSYSEVRRELRKELGYGDGDVDMSVFDEFESENNYNHCPSHCSDSSVGQAASPLLKSPEIPKPQSEIVLRAQSRHRCLHSTEMDMNQGKKVMSLNNLQALLEQQQQQQQQQQQTINAMSENLPPDIQQILSAIVPSNAMGVHNNLVTHPSIHQPSNSMTMRNLQTMANSVSTMSLTPNNHQSPESYLTTVHRLFEDELRQTSDQLRSAILWQQQQLMIITDHLRHVQQHQAPPIQGLAVDSTVMRPDAHMMMPHQSGQMMLNDASSNHMMLPTSTEGTNNSCHQSMDPCMSFQLHVVPEDEKINFSPGDLSDSC
ncbi:circadian locomoter output cycles protein kaput-like [Gigantopelta aegis]|uniref:circadian locomoter output cycles protein kaput-like n=1 Tax=Gigantopelta aegis TaxID=1735272 RepID=UPI001B889B69|nr:circadian locomoter output cycles protein kaput-like [Gigantopelta aegis]